jgi:purine-binding chemotaxis protein CheW
MEAEQVHVTKQRGTPGKSEGSAQYLTFIMASEEYGVDILRVNEIRGWERTTPLPNSASYVKGVINLRGAIVPIVDLREKFGIQNLEYGQTTVVIVLKVESKQGERIMGIVVDAVSDVYSVSDDQKKAAPEVGGGASFISGLVSVHEKMVILLDIDQLLGMDDIETDLSQALNHFKTVH